MRRKNLQSATRAENLEYANAHENWVEQSDCHLSHEHWHMDHWPVKDMMAESEEETQTGEPGEETTDSSAELEQPADGDGWDFLWWHRFFMRDFEDNLGLKGLHNFSPMPYWVSGNPPPGELREFEGTGDDPQTGEPRWTDSGMQTVPPVNPFPSVVTPTWLTFEGGTEGDPKNGHKSLMEFPSTDHLGIGILSQVEGQDLTTTSYHGSVHADCGGWIATHESPKDHIFYPWHAYVDHIWREWQRRAMPPPRWFAHGGGVDAPDAMTHKLFVRAPDGSLQEGTFKGESWSWASTGKEMYGETALLLRGFESGRTNTARIHLFVQGEDRYVWERYMNGRTWRWFNTGLEVDGNPVLVAHGNRASLLPAVMQIKLFVRGLSRDAEGELVGVLCEGTRTEKDGVPQWTWDNSTHREKVIESDPVAMVYGTLGSASSNAVRINLFVCVPEDRGESLWVRAWDGSRWDWVPLSQSTAQFVADDPVVVSHGSLGGVNAADIRIQVYVKSISGTLMEAYWQGSAWGWREVLGRDSKTGAEAPLASVGRPTVLTYGDHGSVAEEDVPRYLFLQSTGGQFLIREPDGTVVDTGIKIDGEPVVVAYGDTSTKEAPPSAMRIHAFIRVLELEAAGTHGGSGEWDPAYEDPNEYPFYVPQLKLWRASWDGKEWSLTDTGKEVVGYPTAVLYGDLKSLDAGVRVSVFAAVIDPVERWKPASLWEYHWDGAAWAWRDMGLKVPS